MSPILPWTGAAIIALSAIQGLAADTPFAVYKSTNRGVSWIRSDDGLPGNARINAFAELESAVLAGTDSGILRSTNAARSWSPIAEPLRDSGRILCFAVLGGRVFARTDRGLQVSLDAGVTWSPVSAFPSLQIRCLCVRGSELLAGTDAHGVLISRDDGRTWSSLGPGLPADAQVFALETLNGRLFAGLYSRGLYVWDPAQNAWRRTGSVVPLALAAVDRTLVAGHNPGGLHWSADGGVSWSRGGEPTLSVLASPELTDASPVWQMAGGGGLVIAGAAAGIFISEDRGRTWIAAHGGLPAGRPGIAFHAAPGWMLAAVGGAGTAAPSKP
ncbi:MAG: hypothetical protein JNL10_01505 [Verrucomicrobiales bacterium]|nr:hypothetical protein [Verrucomicrobiales bacterium]